MFRKFFPGKLARFAILIQFVFLLAMSSFGKVNVLAQAGDTSDEELAKTLVLETAKARGWAQPEVLDINELSAYCTTGNALYDVAGGGIFDRDFVIVFPTAADAEAYATRLLAGEITCGYGEQQTPWWDINSVPITFHGIQAVQVISVVQSDSVGVEGYRRDFLGWPMKNFFIACWEDGAINGNPRTGCVEYMYHLALQHGLGENVSPNPNPVEPDPNIDPNTNPNPNPAPSPIDPETISILQFILGTPILPITGAVAGGLLAWVISMLGGRTVLPPVSRTPTGGIRPGQAGPDGRIWSPTGQGWVSKSLYDYQQKWLQKGWRWNSQTGRFEGQHGSVNENGQVLDNDLGWVDQKVFNENEQMRAQGLVYDRNLGFKSSDELNQSRSDQDAIRQRSREFSAVKDAEIQRGLALDQRARDEAWKKWEQDLARKEQIREQMEDQQDNAREQVRKAYYYDGLSKTVKGVEIAADVAISVAAQYTGPAGKAIEKAYFKIKDVAAAANTAYEKKSLKAGLDEYIDSKKPGLTDNIFKLVPKSIKKGVMKSVKNVILNPTNRKAFYAGAKKLKDQAVDYASDAASEELDELKDGYLNKSSQELMDGLERPMMDGQGKPNFPDKNVDEKTYQDGIKAIGFDPSIFTGGNPPSTPGI